MNDGMVDWFLEGDQDAQGHPIRMRLGHLPCLIGRREDVGLTLGYPSVSGRHAELFLDDGQLHIRDLSSTNGTYVNREQVNGTKSVRDGDVLHFGQAEFRLVRRDGARADVVTMPLDLHRTNLPHELPTGVAELGELLESGAVEPHFQPLVDLNDGSLHGYEILGRGAAPNLPTAPYELFRIAAAAGREVQLSRLFRDRGVAVGAGLPERPLLYVNTHPAELQGEGLLESLTRLRAAHPDVKLVIEVHEGAVLGAAPMSRLASRLRTLDMGLAYDDFGAGQARLVQLVHVPPDVLKFDIAFIRDIHKVDAGMRKMIAALVAMAVDHGSRCLAEGVECIEEAEVCKELGFELAQGWHFGRPAPAPVG